MISVVVPTHNRRTLLSRALHSVQTQSLNDWELIVVDDGSSDDTSVYLQSLARTWTRPQRLRLVRQKNRGVSAARNAGAREARGDWLAFLDSDDEWLDNKLELQMRLSGEYVWIHGEEIWRRNGRDVSIPRKYAKSGGQIFTRCVEVCAVSTSTTLIRRDVFRDFREDFPVCEDFELWLHLSARYPAGFVSTPVIIKHGGHADQLSRRYHSMDYYRAKALLAFLPNPDVKRVLREKCEILIQGNRKYGRDTTEIEVWLRSL